MGSVRPGKTNPHELRIVGGAKSGKDELQAELRTELEAAINGFAAWLRKTKKLHVEPAERYSNLKLPRPTSEDWIMRVRESEVQFNTYITGHSSFDYFRLVVLHECFHLFVQDVPNKSDAKRFRDDFGDVFMKLLDIEADYFTAMYYKEILHASLVSLFSLYYQGSLIFGDPKIRAPKLERFIGSVLSIANAYFENPGSRQTKENDLYLPSISNIPTEERIHVLISHNNHFSLGEIHADLHDFLEIKRCYTGAGENKVERRRYVRTLLEFSSKALGKPIPTAIYRELQKL